MGWKLRPPCVNLLDARAFDGLILSTNMSDETASSPENSPPAETTAPARARRVSNPRPKKKVAKAAEVPTTPEPQVTRAPVQAVVQESSKSIPSQATETTAVPSAENDWPEPEAASNGNQGAAEGAKRKRRRRKGKGKSEGGQQSDHFAQEQTHSVNTDSDDEVEQAPVPKPLAALQPAKGSPQQQHQRVRVDPEVLTKMARKIYLAEIGEEGIALISDNDAKDLSRRCFRLAEIFVEEQSRRR